MIGISDFVRLPYTPDITEGGIAFVLRSLPHGGLSFDKIRRRVAGAVVELAFRRYLSQQDIPFEIIPATPFTEPNKHDVSLGRHRCDIKSFLISHRDQILQMKTNPTILLNAPALVPADLHAGDGNLDNDLYLFAFLSGLVVTTRNDLRNANESNQPNYFIQFMPEAWRKPFNWIPLAPLVLKSESNAEMQVEISGQDQSRDYLTRLINIPSKMRVTVNDPFYSVTAIHVKKIPSARLGIHSPVHKDTHIITPDEWGNIWVNGTDIILTGFISRGDFRRRAKLIPSNTRVFQYDHTKTKNMAVIISELYPLQDLFARVRNWKSS